MIGEMRTAFWLLCLGILLAVQHGVAERKIVCYYTNWSVYRPGTAKFSPQNINPYLCTHLIYAFGGFTKDNILKPFDKYQDIEKGGYAKFNGLKTYNKNLKTLLAIGGWNEGSSRFSPMVADEERRREFVKNTVKFLRQNHFDGLDLDWEYPAFRDGGKPRDKDNYANLVQELREEFERESSKTGRPRLLLSMAVPAGVEYMDKGYDIPRLNEYLDFINLLSYDYHSAYEPAVNHHSPLYPLEEDNEYNYDSELTIDYSINHLISSGASPEKIILGIPTYGRSYTLFNEESTDLGSPADGPGEEGDATREKGYLAYYEICEGIAASDDWEVVQPNPKAMGPYAFKGNQWVGYDDEDIVKLKARYVNERNLGGIMFWSIDNDDFRGKCHGRPYPLIEAAKEAMLTEGPTRTVSHKKSGDSRKKIRNQGIQSNAIGRKLGSSRRSTTTAAPITRKRTSSRTKYRTISRPKYSEEEEAEDRSVDRRSYSASIEDEEAEGGNIVRTVEKSERSRPKTRLRTRSRSTTRRRKNSRKENKENREPKDEVNLSNKLTTPEPPTTPDPGTDFKCEDEGFFPHPRDCKKYFWCLDSGPSGLGVVAHQFTCPSGLVFNKAADSCDYPRNVACPKTKTQSSVSTTRAPITAATSRTTYLHTSTRRTTTTTPDSEEDYEYYDEEDGTEEEEDEEVEEKEERKVTSTSKPLQYKTINRSRSTTTTTTTTTTAKPEKLESDLEEDPRVIKELIDLIRKAGGIEQLEKQLLLQDKNSDTTSGSESVTPATISRTLYERVLNRQGNRNANKQSSASSGKSNYENGPGGAQFEGLDNIPEVKSLRRTHKPQYVTIERPKPATKEPPVEDEEEEDDELIDEETESDTSEEHSFNNPAATSSSTQRVTPNYVNIRRNRPASTTARSENDVGAKDEEVEDERPIRRRRPTFSKNRDEEGSKPTRIRGSTIRSTGTSNEPPELEESEEKTIKKTRITNGEDETPTTKSRYITIQRFRSTTPKAFNRQSEKSENESNVVVLETTTEPIATTIIEKQEETTLAPVPTTTSPSSTTEATLVTQETTESPISIESSSTEGVKLVEDSATEILLTTAPASSSQFNPPSSTTAKLTVATVSQPRPFGFTRRSKPEATTPASQPSTSTSEQRSKVSITPRNFAFLVGRGRLRPRTESPGEERTRATKSDGVDDGKTPTTEEITVVQRTRPRYRGTSKYTPPTGRPKVEESREPNSGRSRARTRQANLSNSGSTSSTVRTVSTTPRTERRRFRRPNGRTAQILSTEATKTNELEDSPIIRIHQGLPRRASGQRLRSNVEDETSAIVKEDDRDKEKVTNIKVFKRPGSSVNRELYDRLRFNRRKSEDNETASFNEVREAGLARKSNEETLIATATSSSLLQGRGERTTSSSTANYPGRLSSNTIENEIEDSPRSTTEFEESTVSSLDSLTSTWTTAGYTFATESVTEGDVPFDNYESTSYEGADDTTITQYDSDQSIELGPTTMSTESDDYYITKDSVENTEMNDIDSKNAEFNTEANLIDSKNVENNTEVNDVDPKNVENNTEVNDVDPKNVESVTEAAADRSVVPRRRKVLIRRRPVTASVETISGTATTTPATPTTSAINIEASSTEPNVAEKEEEIKRPIRRRKVIRRLRPVQSVENSSPSGIAETEVVTESLKSISDNLLEAFTSVTEVPTEFTTNKDSAFYSTTWSPTMSDDDNESTDAILTTESSMATDSLTTDATTFSLTTLPRSTDFDPTESTLTEQTTQALNTETMNTTTSVNPPNSRSRGFEPRYVRKKFIRKRPLSSAEVSGVRSSVTNSLPSTTARNLEALSKRRKNLFIRRRPVSSTTVRTTEALDEFIREEEDIEEEEEEEEEEVDPYEVESQQIADDTKISPVENYPIPNYSIVKSDSDEFWRHYTTASTPPPIPIAFLASHQDFDAQAKDYFDEPNERFENNRDYDEEFDDNEETEEKIAESEHPASTINKRPELRPRYKVPDSLRRLATASTETPTTAGKKYLTDSSPEESEEYSERNDARLRVSNYRQPRTRYRQNFNETETTPRITTQYTEYFTLTEPTLKGRLNARNRGIAEYGVTETLVPNTETVTPRSRYLGRKSIDVTETSVADTEIPSNTEGAITTLLRSRFLPWRSMEIAETTENPNFGNTEPISQFWAGLRNKPADITESGITETEIPQNTETIAPYRTRYLSRKPIDVTEAGFTETEVPQNTETIIPLRSRYLSRKPIDATEAAFTETEIPQNTGKVIPLRSRYLSRRPVDTTEASFTETEIPRNTEPVTSFWTRYLSRKPVDVTEAGFTETEIPRNTEPISLFRTHYLSRKPVDVTEASFTETEIPQTTEPITSFRARPLPRKPTDSTDFNFPESNVPQATVSSITTGIRNRYLSRRITEPETTESVTTRAESYSITSGLRNRYLSRKPAEPETTESPTASDAGSITASLRARYLSRRPTSEPSTTEAISSTTDDFRPTSRLRFYTKRPTPSTEATVTETLIPAKKFDYVADAHHRRQQSLRTTVRPNKVNATEPVTKSQDENLEENFVDDNVSLDFTTSKPTKSQVTRLVTSVAESGTTERQKILIKTKYSSLTSTTRIPVQNGERLSYSPTTPSGFETFEKSPDSEEVDDESINEIRQSVERSTLPIESEFSHRGQRRFTTESHESSTIEIESVFSNLIRGARDYKQDAKE